jgi:hypothetical protein
VEREEYLRLLVSYEGKSKSQGINLQNLKAKSSIKIIKVGQGSLEKDIPSRI